MTFKNVEGLQNTYIHDDMFEGNALFAVKVEGLNPQRNAIGALFLDFDQSEILRSALHHLQEQNSSLKEFHEPFNRALNDLSYLLSNVSIRRNG